jgi:kynurenine 3-monooxygenase
MSTGGAPSTEQKHFDFCVGADGSYSNVRRQLMRVVRYVHQNNHEFSPFGHFALIFPIFSMNFQQEYIAHEYVELRLAAGSDDSGNSSFLLDPNYLHIWPRHSFMLIALPNQVYTYAYILDVCI